MSTTTTAQEPRWRRLPEERPRQIMEAALEVFGDRGLAGARIEDIARLAGVSKGTVYLYFPTKEALFCAMVREKIGDTITRTEARIAEDGGTASDQLRTYLGALWASVRSPLFESLYRLVHGELHHFPNLLAFYIQEVSGRSMRVVEQILERGIAAGEFRALDASVAARMLHALVVKHGQWATQRDCIPFLAGIPDDRLLEQITDFYLHAIQATPAAPMPADSHTE